MAIYGPSKAFVLSFSEALWAENRSPRSSALSRTSGTEFFEAFDGQEPAPMSRRDTTENTVRTALRALDRGRSHVFSGSPFYLLLLQSGRAGLNSALVRTSERILRPSAKGEIPLQNRFKIKLLYKLLSVIDNNVANEVPWPSFGQGAPHMA